MYSSPWLAVAAYARAPAADAPMATDIAANSDSTLMNSHGVRRPDFTSRLSASTMWVCGEIGYAQITSGLQRATVAATPADPSIWTVCAPSLLGRAGAGLLLSLLAERGTGTPSPASSAAT